MYWDVEKLWRYIRKAVSPNSLHNLAFQWACSRKTWIFRKRTPNFLHRCGCPWKARTVLTKPLPSAGSPQTGGRQRLCLKRLPSGVAGVTHPRKSPSRGGGGETPLPVKKAARLKLGSHPFSILISFGSCFLLCYTALKLQLAAHNSTHFNIRTLYQSLSLWCFSKTDWITWIPLKIMFLFYRLLFVLLRWPGYL